MNVLKFLHTRENISQVNMFFYFVEMEFSHSERA